MRKAVVILALWFVAACVEEKDDGPTDGGSWKGVSGAIDLAPGISLEGYIGIANVVYYPDRPVPYSLARTPVGLFDLPSTWPTTFATVPTNGGGSTGNYPLRAWLSREHNETAPSAGAPVAETTVFITCEPECEAVTDVMLVLRSPTE